MAIEDTRKKLEAIHGTWKLVENEPGDVMHFESVDASPYRVEVKIGTSGHWTVTLDSRVVAHTIHWSEVVNELRRRLL